MNVHQLIRYKLQYRLIADENRTVTPGTQYIESYERVFTQNCV